MLKRTFMILLLVIAVFVLFSNQEAGAVADGNGSCSGVEETNNECAYFGASAVEFLGVKDGMCVGKPCTVYYYKYTGAATNQINVAIPLHLTKGISIATEIGCSQYVIDGNGDPTTGFGKYFSTFGVCRTAPTASSFPIVPPTTNANFYIATDRSFFDRAEPLPWAIKMGRDLYVEMLVGPVASVLPVEQSAATLTTTDGKSVSYTVQGGEVTITGSVGTSPETVPIENTKLCVPCASGELNGPTNKFGNYCCETISYATENCDIKTTGTDPCRFIGGYCLKY